MKKLFILLTIVILPFVLSSCHGGRVSTNFTVPATFDETKEYNITFWAKNDSNAYQVKVYNETIERFEKLYPNIHVLLDSSYTDYQKIYSDVITNISTGTTPNLCISYPDHVATYLKGNNVVVALDELYNNEDYGFGGTKLKYTSVKEDVIETYYNEGILNENFYCLPFMRSSEACYVNVDLLRSLGYELPDVLTWDFVWEVCKKARELNTSSKFIPLIYKSTDNMMINMCYQYEIDYTTDSGDVLLFNDALKDLIIKLGDYAKNKYFDTFKHVGYPGNFYNRGNCIFAIDSTAGATWMGSSAPLIDIPASEVVEFETVVMPVPQASAQHQKMISQGPSLCIFNKEDPDEVLATWIFAQYLLNEQTQIAYAKTEGYLPVTKSAIHSTAFNTYLESRDEHSEEFYSVKIDATKMILKNLDSLFVTPVFSGSTYVRYAAGNLIEQLIYPNYRPIQDKVEDLFKDTNSLYKLDNIRKTQNNYKIQPGAILLLSTICFIWAILGTKSLVEKLKNKKS